MFKRSTSDAATKPLKAGRKPAVESLEIERLRAVVAKDREAFDALYRDYYPG